MPPTVAGLYSLSDVAAPYLAWQMRIKTFGNMGNGAMPLSGPPGKQSTVGAIPVIGGQKQRQSQAIVQCSSFFGWMLVYWYARRMGVKPALPTMVPYTDNAVLHVWEVDTGPTSLYQDSTTTFEYTGRYLYYLKKPMWPLDGLPGGFSPNYTLTSADNAVPGTLFQQFIVSAEKIATIKEAPALFGVADDGKGTTNPPNNPNPPLPPDIA